MTYDTWQDSWEAFAAKERKTLLDCRVEDLLADIRSGRFGQYYAIWPAVAERATLEQAGWTLLAVLESNAEYLLRYHCAVALLSLLGDGDTAPVDLSGSHDGLRDRLADVSRVIAAVIGPRP